MLVKLDHFPKHLRLFQHTPGTYPTPWTKTLWRNSFHLGVWGCLGMLQGYVGVLLESRDEHKEYLKPPPRSFLHFFLNVSTEKFRSQVLSSIRNHRWPPLPQHRGIARWNPNNPWDYPKAPWDVGPGVKLPPAFFRPQRCHFWRVWCFHRKGQDS